MLNEIEEFRAYTVFPEYTAKNKYDSTYLGRFTFDTLVKCEGLNRVLTVLARGYLWRDGEANTDRAYDALRAWCWIGSKPTRSKQKGGERDAERDRRVPGVHDLPGVGAVIFVLRRISFSILANQGSFSTLELMRSQFTLSKN